MSNPNKWTVDFLPEALDDPKNFDGSNKLIIMKAIVKVSANPLPQSEGGYGKPLGNKAGNDLSRLLKIKLKKSGIRIIYTLIRENGLMRIIIIGLRANNEVYINAAKRIDK